MGDKKVVFKFFTICQYQQEEEYLSSMHEKGWRLVKVVFPGRYYFEKCEPRKVAYRLDYNQDGVKNKEEYVQMFSDCGWDYLFDFVGYSYFCKEGGARQEREEIFCDDLSRLDMMKRVYKGRVIPLIILFAMVILPQFFANTLGYGEGSRVQDALSITFMVLAVLYLAIFSVMAYQFYQYEKGLWPEKAGIKYKYYGTFLLILLVAIGMGVFFYFTKRSVYTVSERADGFTVEAERLNETVVMEYSLRKGDRIAVSHDYGGGELFIRVKEEKEAPIFYGNSYGKIGDFNLEIQEDGLYRIECSGRRARGVVEFVIK